MESFLVFHFNIVEKGKLDPLIPPSLNLIGLVLVEVQVLATT